MVVGARASERGAVLWRRQPTQRPPPPPVPAPPAHPVTLMGFTPRQIAPSVSMATASAPSAPEALDAACKGQGCVCARCEVSARAAHVLARWAGAAIPHPHRCVWCREGEQDPPPLPTHPAPPPRHTHPHVPPPPHLCCALVKPHEQQPLHAHSALVPARSRQRVGGLVGLGRRGWRAGLGVLPSPTRPPSPPPPPSPPSPLELTSSSAQVLHQTS